MLRLFEHVINGAVAEYIVRDEHGARVATFNASEAGHKAALAYVYSGPAYGSAMAKADDGWSQPDIRQALMGRYNLTWAAADMIATDAVAADNAKRLATATGRA